MNWNTWCGGLWKRGGGQRIQSTGKDQRPKVGVGVMILKDGKVLMTRRKGSHGSGEYSFPGGHLEYMETFEECAKRETLEECGLKIKKIRFSFVTNLKRYAPKHYVHIGMIADWESGEPQLLEPEKAEEWKWYDIDDCPEKVQYLNSVNLLSIHIKQAQIITHQMLKLMSLSRFY